MNFFDSHRTKFLVLALFEISVLVAAPSAAATSGRRSCNPPLKKTCREYSTAALAKLNKGEYLRVWIPASQAWASGRIHVKAGEAYRFEVHGDQTWKDLFAKVRADGRASWCYRNYMKLFNRFKRAKGQPWFALIGNIGKDSPKFAFLIGNGTERRFDQEGDLYCFANDLKCMYWNNSGCLELTITRFK